ncbi:hypothetical protein [Companilactobacillus formosensis]|uniref:hypothetical protein n=1 Tax=Companilactobacillus formosensis TaxID=1617889 RepID=UPI000E64EA9F|nr:hypothetical protein [Companilactobacillus formosensis]
MESIFGVLFILIGIWQLFISIKYLNVLKKVGNKTTSGFSPLAIYFSLFIGVVFLVIGISAVFHLI